MQRQQTACPTRPNASLAVRTPPLRALHSHSCRGRAICGGARHIAAPHQRTLGACGRGVAPSPMPPPAPPGAAPPPGSRQPWHCDADDASSRCAMRAEMCARARRGSRSPGGTAAARRRLRARVSRSRRADRGGGVHARSMPTCARTRSKGTARADKGAAPRVCRRAVRPSWNGAARRRRLTRRAPRRRPSTQQRLARCGGAKRPRGRCRARACALCLPLPGRKVVRMRVAGAAR